MLRRDEALLTKVAFERFLASVGLYVCGEAILLSETFIASETLVFFLALMALHMSVEFTLGNKALEAFFALMGFLASVNHVVPRQLAFAQERFLAYATLKGPLACMRSV